MNEFTKGLLVGVLAGAGISSEIMVMVIVLVKFYTQ